MRNKKLEKNTRQRKIITHTKQYLHGSTISLYPRSCRDFTIIREKYKVRQCRFFLSQKLQRQTLITKNNVFYILHTGFTMGYKRAKKFSMATKPQKISHLKTMQHYFGSGRHLDQTQLGSTKPNIIFLHLFLFRKDRHWSWVERHHDANYEILVRSS